MLAPIAATLTDWVTRNISLAAPQIPYLSNVTGALITDAQATRLRQPHQHHDQQS